MKVFIFFQILFGVFSFFSFFREISGTPLSLPLSYKKEDLDRFESGFTWGKNPEEGPYAEGDMITAFELGNGVRDKSKLWPYGIVYFQIDGDFNSKELSLISKAMQHIHKKTCIRFKERLNEERDYVSIIKPDDGCSATVGKQKGEKTIRLAGSCFKSGGDLGDGYGSAAHEMLHSLGIKHEQSRSDRDDFVVINEDNVKDGTEGETDQRNNFKKVRSQEYSNFGLSYDYGSVMHYNSRAFLKKRFEQDEDATTIDPTRDLNGKVMGQRQGLSDLDARKVSHPTTSDDCRSAYITLALIKASETSNFDLNLTMAIENGMNFISQESVCQLDDNYITNLVSGTLVAGNHPNKTRFFEKMEKGANTTP